MLVWLQREPQMTAAAKLVESRFGCLAQIRPSAVMARVAVAGTGPVNEIVVAGDAVDGSMMLVREKRL